MVYDFFDPKAILTHTPFLTLGVQGASTVEPEGQVAHPLAWKESHVFLLESPWLLVQWCKIHLWILTKIHPKWRSGGGNHWPYGWWTVPSPPWLFFCSQLRHQCQNLRRVREIDPFGSVTNQWIAKLYSWDMLGHDDHHWILAEPHSHTTQTIACWNLLVVGHKAFSSVEQKNFYSRYLQGVTTIHLTFQATKVWPKGNWQKTHSLVANIWAPPWALRADGWNTRLH